MTVLPDRRFNIKFGSENDDQRLTLAFGDGTSTVGLGFGEVHEVTVERDYDRLYNKPSINGVELAGNQTTESLGINPLPEGGQHGDILMNAGGGVSEWRTPASSAEADNTLPITAAAVYTEIGNINALLETI